MAATKHDRLTQADKIIVTGRSRVRPHRQDRLFKEIFPDDPKDVQKLRPMIERALENVELIRQRMANDQIEIDALRIETRATLAQILT